MSPEPAPTPIYSMTADRMDQTPGEGEFCVGDCRGLMCVAGWVVGGIMEKGMNG